MRPPHGEPPKKAPVKGSGIITGMTRRAYRSGKKPPSPRSPGEGALRVGRYVRFLYGDETASAVLAEPLLDAAFAEIEAIADDEGPPRATARGDGPCVSRTGEGRMKIGYARVNTAVEIARPGGAVGRVGVPHYPGVPPEKTFYKKVVVGGGPAPVRAYIDELLPDVLNGRIHPGRVFDRAIGLDEVPEGIPLHTT
jgi:threonine dehydrogenase-like Zn-dependent dehydrogenase